MTSCSKTRTVRPPGTGVYNGDVGQITAIDPQTETLAVCYDGKTRDLRL